MDGGLARGDVLHVPQRQVGPLIHPTQASLRRFFAKHIQPRPTPVHSRDAPCVRPAALRASCRFACVLRTCPCYADVRASCRCACVSIQDADKQRPYYGRGFGAWRRFTRTPTPGRPADPSHPGKFTSFLRETHTTTTNPRP